MRKIGCLLVAATLLWAACAGGATDSATQPASNPAARITCVWGGARETIALRSDGTVWAWGHNGMGQLGIGNTKWR